jgi:glutathione synthase
MPLRIAIQMDRLDSINPMGDSTLRLGVEAQARGHTLFYYTPDTLTLREDGKLVAHTHPVRLSLDVQRYYELGEAQTLDLSTLDVVLLRQDPPFDMTYLSTTYLLETLTDTLVLNRPASVRNRPEKLFPLSFRQFMPPTIVSADVAELERFWQAHGDVVIKPLYGYGGRGIFRLRAGDDNFHSLLEMMFSQSREPVMAQQFLPEVKDADRRILLVDGQVCGVFGRIPAGDEIRANMRVGGVPVKAELTTRQKEICAALGPVLKEEGLFFVGLDCIGDWLTEINVTSPTGLAAITNLYGTKVETTFWERVEALRA